MTMARLQQTVEWDDPTPGLAALPELDGLEYLRRLAAGDLPGAPFASHTAMLVTEVAPGTVTFECRPDASHYNPLGTVHGGLIATLLDSAVGCATHTTLPAGTGFTSIEIKVNFLRPVSAASGPLTCIGRVTKSGRRVTFAEATATDNQDKVVATASSSLLIFPMR